MPTLTRISLWLSRGDNAFTTLLYATMPPLATIIAIGML